METDKNMESYQRHREKPLMTLRERDTQRERSFFQLPSPPQTIHHPHFPDQRWKRYRFLPASLPIRERTIRHKAPFSTDRKMDSHKSSALARRCRLSTPPGRQAREGLRTESRMSMTSLRNLAILKSLEKIL